MKKLLNFFSNISFLLRNRALPGSLVIAYTLKNNKRKFLLIKSRHSKAITFSSGCLNLLEDFYDAAKREFFEETGLFIKKLIPTPLVHEFRYKNLPLKIKSYQKVFWVCFPTIPASRPKDKDVEWIGWYDSKKVLRLLTFEELKLTFRKAIKFTM